MPVSASATVTKTDNKRFSATAVTGVARQALLTVSATASAVMTKSVNVAFSAVTPPAAFVTKAAGKIYTRTAPALATISTSSTAQVKVLTASVVATGSYTLSALRTFKTGATIPLPPIFSSATPQAVLTVLYGQGKILTASVVSNVSLVKLMAFRFPTLVTSSTATVARITALAVRIFTATVVQVPVLVKQMVTTRTVSVVLVPTVQRLLNRVRSVTLTVTSAVSAVLTILSGEDVPADPSQSGLTLTSVAKGALSLASTAKDFLYRKDI